MARFADVSVQRNVPGRDDRPGVLLRFPFDPDVQAELMSALPKPDRYWFPEAGGWWVAADGEEAAVGVLFTKWAEIRFTSGTEADYLMDRNGVIHEQGGLFD